MEIKALTLEEFDDVVLKSEKPVLIDFWATWCGPCRMMSPIVDEFAEKHPEVTVCKVNVDDEPELADRFGIFAIPTLIVFENGEVKSKAAGGRDVEGIEELFE